MPDTPPDQVHTTHTKLPDLPPELLDQVISHVNSAQTVANLSTANRRLHDVVERNGWTTFNRERFPGFAQVSGRTAARTLTSLSRAWDRRAIVAKTSELYNEVTTYPGGKKLSQFRVSRGQTMGFVPDVDAYEKHDQEILAYSAGAEVRFLTRTFRLHNGKKLSESTKHTLYRPLSAVDGKDDVTAISLVRHGHKVGQEQLVYSGTANGDLHLTSVPSSSKHDSKILACFVTEGLAVKAMDTFQNADRHLLAVALGNDQQAFYVNDHSQTKYVPTSKMSLKTSDKNGTGQKPGTFHTRATTFLSGQHLASGYGPHYMPLAVHKITPTGLDLARRFKLEDRQDATLERLTVDDRSAYSSIYAIKPAPASENNFYSGAYDGIIRLHDLRSPRDVVLILRDGTEDSAIYSLLTKGSHMLIAGTSQFAQLKLFDVRMQQRPYSYRQAIHRPKPSSGGLMRLYLRREAISGPGSRRTHLDGSVYALASASQESPMVYAGTQNGVIDLAFTELNHAHPDTRWFEAYNTKKPDVWNGWRKNSHLRLVQYDPARGKTASQIDFANVRDQLHTGKDDTDIDFRWT